MLFAAQQHVDGGVVELAPDIPQSQVDGGNAGEDNRAAVLAPEGALVQLIPDHFIFQGIHAENQAAEILQLAKGGFAGGAVVQGGFAVALNAFVRVNAAGNGAGTAGRALQAHNINFCDLHETEPPSYF